MIRIRKIGDFIKINCSKNQVIRKNQLVRMYRSGSNLIKQNGNLPIIIDVERNVRLSDDAQSIFNRLGVEVKNRTVVILCG